MLKPSFSVLRDLWRPRDLLCWKALLGGLFRSRPSTTWPTDCSRLADGRRVQPVQSGISIQAFHKIRIQVLANHRPPHSQVLRFQSDLKFPSQAVWSSARLPGPCTPITLWVVVHFGLLGRCCCWPTGTCARAPAGGRGEPSLPGPPSQLGLQRHRAVLCRRPKLSKSRLSSTPPPTPPPPSSSSL